MVRTLSSQKDSYDVISSNRSDTNLFEFEETKKLIEKCQPDALIIAAARVGGIVANNTKRTEFILENLKINIKMKLVILLEMAVLLNIWT